MIVQELKIELDLPWMDALRLEFALGYKVELTPRRIPRNMVRMSPLESYHGEYFVRKWLEDTRDIMKHGLVEVGILVNNVWYLWTLDKGLEYFSTVDMTNL